MGVGLLLALVVLVGVAQLVLPKIAAKVVRGIVAKYGDVQSVKVSATPAIQLLWGKADSAQIAASKLSVSPKQLVSVLLEAGAVTDLTVTAKQVVVKDPGFGANPIALQDVKLRKEGAMLRASCVLSQASLSQALPEGVQAQVVSGQGGGIEVRAGGQLFGFRAYILATVHATEGKLLLTPTQPLLAGLARITLFANPKLQVLSVSAAPAEGEPGTWAVRAEARLR